MKSLPTVAILAALVLLTRAKTEKRQATGPACIPQDITYMVDSSSYIGYNYFLQELAFIKSNLNYYNLDPRCTRISIVTYSSGVYNQFYLNQYTNKQQLYNAIDAIQYHAGGSNTYDAINYVYQNSFDANHGGRTGVPHYGILVTGSSSSNPMQTVQAANAARASGMQLYTVGIGSGVNMAELNSISSYEKNSFFSQTYNSMDSLSGPLTTRINGAISPTSTQSLGTPNTCLQQADIAFLVDGSGSIGSANFLKLENFMKGIVGQLDVAPNKVHVGLVQFSNYPKQEFALNTYTTRQDVMTEIDQMHYMGGGTNTADGIRYVREQVFSSAGGARSNVPRVMVVITDGKSSNSAQTAAEADKARQNNIGVIAVGVGSGVDVNELHSIADDPDSANTFQVADYDQLNSIAAQIIQRTCQVSATSAPPTAPGAVSLGAETCFDNITNCDKFDRSVCSGSYFMWAKDNCARWCGFCTPVYTTAPPPCVDKLTNCNDYKPESCFGDFKSWAMDNCRKYCGYCDSTAQSVGFYGKCYYKGHTYSQGQSWDDGCDYTCTCTDSATGKYECHNKCPIYQDLPTQCTLVKDESSCCLKPVCDFTPKITSFESTAPAKTPDGISVCEYKGHNYYQGQSWQDGCQYTCVCEDSTTGRYKCQTLCPTYQSIPTYCHMVQNPGECCAKPICEFRTSQGSFTGSGTISGHGTGISPTAPPACTDALADCDRYGQNACINFKPWARDNCRKYCNLCVDQAPNPEPTDVCLYEGRAFHQGETWKLGCDTTCTCENAVYGYYRCVNSCPVYNNLPSTCQEVKKTGDCCMSVECQPGTTFLTSTGNLASLGNGGLISVPGMPTPTLPSGATPAPGTGGTGYVAPSIKGCLYKGQVYIQGQTWEDGCQYTCTCDDATMGHYTCNAKCPTFPNLPSECHLDTDPENPCCQKPVCQFTGTPVPVMPVFNAGTSGQNLVEPPKPNELYQGTQTVVYSFTIGGSGNGPTANPNITGGIGHCEYKGHQYTQAQQWEDGCLYNCVCEDATIGFYRCREKCQKYNNLPPQCHLIQDPNNRCCQIPTCDFTGQVTSITGQGTTQAPSIITQAPTPGPGLPGTQAPKLCVYKGQSYSQNQQWFDGCDKKCICNDATVGYYTCQPRCADYFNVPTGCTYVPDPNDPGCCRVPSCTPTPPPGRTLAPNVIPTIPPGTHIGQVNTTAYVGYCTYKGQMYKQGDTWSDGCDYNCVCENQATGKYVCTDKCPAYAALPAGCRMVADFANPCCQKPTCDFTGTTGEITGTLSPSQPQTPKYCVYKNAQYSQGQQWNDGCQYRCRCDDASKGLYVCDDRCPVYPNVPSQCHMVTDPNDACCSKPQCDFTPTQGQITGTLAPNVIPTDVPSIITGQASTPAPTPGPDGSTPAPMPLTFCVYKGSTYRQGQTWDDGCDYTCRCIDETIGKYQCDEKCPKYSTIPTQCRLIKDAANPCCFKPVCDFTGTTGEVTGQATTIAPLPGQTPAPTPAPLPNPTQAPLPKQVCVYRTDQYTQGQTWYDGCNFKCTCEDALRGVYRCTSRCADYTQALPTGCTLVSDPADPLCCKVPYCAPQPGNTNPNPYPTLPTGHVTGGSVTLAPQPRTTIAPLPGQTPAPTPAPLPQNVCVYKGKTYTEGQRWRDGCDYNCVCTDGMTGVYDCSEICPKYPNIPAECTMVQDYNNPCCMKPYCNFPTTPAPLPGQTPAPTPAPTPKKLCSYNGVLFHQGERWDDGCDLKCVCEDEMTGFYRCDQRCAMYQSVPQGCTLETDPNDACCRVPVCNNLPTPAPRTTIAPLPGQTNAPTPAPTPYIPTLAPPVINGQGVTPTPMPTVPGMTTPAPNPVCVYNGKSYPQGAKWQDGCQYNCECVDGMTGQYRCTERCPVYPSIPANCRLVPSQSDSCCQEPECIQPQPTPAPSIYNTPAPLPGVSTIAPNPNFTPVPNPTPAPTPNKYCVMNGRQYTQGQQWNVGCDQMCVCDDAMSGHYTCSQRCKVYSSVPKECTMVPDPNDPVCCQIPQCIPVPGTNGYPTPGPTDTPTIYTNAPHAVVTGTAPTPTIVPTPAPVPGVVTPAPTPAPQVCVYKGVSYNQGQRWQDGCNYNCVCDDGMTGKYTCTARCGDYPNLPRQCQLQRDPNDYCCYVPVCDWSATTPAPNPFVTPLPQTTVAPLPGQTPAPTPAPTPLPQPKSYCVYNGVTFAQGQTISDGCNKRCRCDDASMNYYNCYNRCPDYPQVPAGCVMVTDPNDACCQIPECNIIPTPAPHVVVTTIAPLPGQTPAPTPAPAITPAPQPVPTAVPGQVINQPNPTRPPTQRGYCVYNGMKYTTGQQWDDGCNYHCVCLDDMTGQYKCTERCARYPSIPSNCVMVTDPNDACCKQPYCTNVQPTPSTRTTVAPNPNPTNAPNPHFTNPTQAPNPQFPNPTLAPNPYPTPGPQPLPKSVCVMNGKAYTQGQQWYDGCQQICVCDDSSTGHYTCNQRCATYNNVASYCVYVPDPSDPMCCQIPQCNQVNSTVPAPVTGQVTGGGPVPTLRPPTTMAPLPGQTPAPNPVVTPAPTPNACVYKGNMYTQGQTWRDGCQYDCTCTDGMNGKYTCTDICPKYPGLPVYCTMVRDPMNPCCQKPDCSTPAPNTVVTPAPLPGQTPAPTPAPRTSFCVYKGVPLKQGEVFQDGCDKLCRCEDTMSNSVVCDDRCPTYPALQPGCTMVTDPNDACCRVPECTPQPNPQTNTSTIPGVPGAVITGSTQPNPSGPVTGSRDMCLYQGKAYTTGQTWDDGCTYHCECVDGMTGNYRCTEKCTRYPFVPPSCSMVQDPSDPCCQKPYCSYVAPTPGPNPVYTPAPQPGHNTAAPLPGQSTPAPNPIMTVAPQPNVCTYKNQMYRQDQVWYDDCNAICKCEDASTGFYRCQERCAKYPSVPSGCTLVPDPQDPTCCKVASCPLAPTSAPNPTPGYVTPNPMYTPAPPMVTGVAPVPTSPSPVVTPAPLPGQTPAPTPAPRTGCFYNGKLYAKGQTFDDGCQFRCTCMDDMTGQYTCTKRCTDYTQQLPPQCQMVQDPNDACCQVPYCDYLNPTPVFPTPVPNPYVTPLPGQTTLSPTPAPPGYCVYKGVYYTQGQMWNDGCQKKCQCDDVSTGYYSCNERCPVYNNLPTTCTLVTDPNDPCCLVPDCNPTPAPIIYQPGTGQPIHGTNPPTTPMIYQPVPVPPAVITGTSSNNPGSSISGSSGTCVYKSNMYTQGQTWDDGCSLKCECYDQSRGQYRCTERCPRYVNLPAYCVYQTDPNDPCCKVPKCDISNISPTTSNPIIVNPGTNPPNTGTNPPATYVPVNPTGITGHRDKCIYMDNTQHPRGSTWQANCETCVCEDPATNSYKCNDRCPVYSDLPSSCYLVPDTHDTCCKVPHCSGTLTPITATGSPQPGTTGQNPVPVGSHSTFTGSGRPDPVPGMTSTASKTVCVYKGVIYQQGQSWDDGCDYTCTCEVASQGLYKCTSKCPAFPASIPTYCKMNKVPGQCCPSLSCNIPQVGNYAPSPGLVPTPAPSLAPGAVPTPSSGNPSVIYPSGTQPVIGGGTMYPGGGYAIPPGVSATGIRNQCVYKNRLYNQGETWDDACDYSCECKDAKTGYYECHPQCPTFTLQAGCYTVKAAGQCCDQPVCKKPDGTSFNPLVNPDSQYPVYGSYRPGTGGFRPGYNPSTGTLTSVSGITNECMYKGRVYRQGQRWDDGCDYHCECTDAAHGLYTCTPICPTYTQLPQNCHMTTLPGQCCQEPSCPHTSGQVTSGPATQPPMTGACVDTINNCDAYGKTSCVAPFEQWAQQNCRNYCGLCSVNPATSAPMGTCVDKLNNCAAYGQSSCIGQYEPWARDNCRKTCNLCGTSGSGIITTAPSPMNYCVDKLTNCDSYDKNQACRDPYIQWAIDNCQKYCNLCTATGNMGTTVSGSITPQGNWMIMMKGVAGVSGDLYSLWSGSRTENANVPEAMYLTSQYHGHYKPDLSNYWSSLCIDRVKLAIFNNGMEKANIIFDATGADKMSWFDPSRIISSTWTDIKYAPKNIFSLLGDPSTGREFLASNSGNGCNMNGWIMVSTQSGCSFEQGSKPAFYYSTGQTATNFGTTAPASGDVIAILAHPNCAGPTNTPVTIVATSAFCIYKSNIYRQGQTWQDGCQYNCTCEDAVTGFYRCTDMCPVWNNLPTGCTLKTKPGECCASPDCPGGTDPANSCLYKGNYYGVGQTWRDGCDYNCECKNGQTGFYQCTSLCLNWNLPSQCHLEPAPAGKCCPVPTCPANIQIQYPPGYVQM